MARHAEAQAMMEARRHDIESANAKVKAALDAKKAETDAAVADSKAKRDVQRLEHRAQLAEDFAGAAVGMWVRLAFGVWFASQPWVAGHYVRALPIHGIGIEHPKMPDSD
jgi:hypothetical protein